MHRKTLAMALALAGCCDRNCMSAGDGEADGEDAPDGGDATSEIDEDCTPGGTGVPPYTDLDACIMAVSCAPPALFSSWNAVELCLAREWIGEAPVGFGTHEEAFAAQLALLFIDEVNRNAPCLADATTCEGAMRCLNSGADSAECTTPSPDIAAWGQGCTGNVLSICLATVAGTTSGVVFTHNCSEEGLDCVSTPALAACMVTDCTTAGDPTCVGDVIDHCIRPGAHHQIDCGELMGETGATCGDGDPAAAGIQAGCVPTGEPCSPTDAPHCVDGVLLTCNEVFGRWVGLDCTEIGEEWACQPDGCVPAETDCTLFLEPACDCDDLLVCDPQSGRDIRVHCPDYGYGSCDEEAPACL